MFLGFDMVVESFRVDEVFTEKIKPNFKILEKYDTTTRFVFRDYATAKKRENKTSSLTRNGHSKIGPVPVFPSQHHDSGKFRLCQAANLNQSVKNERENAFNQKNRIQIVFPD